MKSFISIILGVFTPFYFFGQDCNLSIQGKVVDYHNRAPLAGAMVKVFGTDNYVLSNENGQYLLSGVCPGQIELEVSHIDCQTTFFPLNIEGNLTLDLKLEHHLEELKEVEVVGSKTQNETNSAQETVLQVEAIENYSVASLGEALRQLSGVSSLNTGATIVKPTIHGLTGSRVLILNDGVRMQDMEWGDEHAPNVDINSTGNITVVKGASALKYGGDAIGGVILMEQPKLFLKDTLFGKTILNGVSNGRGGNLTSELTKVFKKGWFVKGQASYKRLGDQEAPDYILSNTGVQEIGASLNFGKQQFEWGWDARYSYYNAEIAVLRASHIGNVDDLIRAINSGEPAVINDFTYDLQNPRQEVTHHLGKLNVYKRFEGLGKWELQYDFQNNRRFEYDIRRGERDGQASIDLELATHSIITNFKWDAKQNLNLDFGLLGRYQDNFANPDTGVRRLIPDYEKYDFGAYLIAEYHLDENWILDSGLRYDFTQIDAKKFYRTSRWEERGYDDEFSDLIIEDLGTQLLVNPVFDYNNISTTLGAQFSRNNDFTFKFNYALAQRAPNPSELFSDGLHHSAARIELGDLRIQSETSHKFSSTIEKSFDRLSVSVAPYINYISDFILLEPTNVEFTVRGAFPVWSYRQTDARILGVDVNAHMNWLENVSSNHQFSLVKGKDLDNNLPLINIPAADIRNSISFQKPNWNNFEITLNSNYVFRQNETLPNITVYSPEQDQEVELAINNAPDAYHLLGLNSKLDFNLGHSKTLTTSLTINNILNTNYREYLNRQRYFANDLGRTIILQLKFNY